MQDYSSILLKYHFLIWLAVGSAVAIAVVLTLFMPDVYEATTTFFFPQRQEIFNIHSVQSTLRTIPFPGVKAGTASPHMGVFRSETLSEMVAKQIEGVNATNLSKNTRFEFSPTSNLFHVTVRQSEPRLAAHVADLYVDQINVLFQRLSLQPTKRAEKFVLNELKTANENFDRVQEGITLFQLENRAMNLGSKTKKIVNKQLNTQFKIDSMRTKYELTNIKIEAHEERMAIEGGMRIPMSAMGSAKIIRRLQPKLINLQLKVSKLRQLYTENHISVLNKQYQIEQIKKTIEMETEKLYKSQVEPKKQFHEQYRKQLVKDNVKQNILWAQMEVLKRKVEEYDREIALLPDLQSKLAKLTFERRHYSRLRKLLDARLLELTVQEKIEASNYIILDKAKVPTGPAFPKLWLNVLVAAIFGFIGSVLYCFLLEYLERSRKSGLKAEEIIVN